jgi:hypothetical protein
MNQIVKTVFKTIDKLNFLIKDRIKVMNKRTKSNVQMYFNR